MSLTAAAIGAGAAMFGAGKSASTAKKNAQMQIAWERERAKNAHQWEVEDLKKAGLNPILSAGGSGAATSGIAPQMPDTSGYTSAGQIMQKGFDQYLANKKINSEIEIASAQKELIKQQELKTIAETIAAQENAKSTKGGVPAKMIGTEIYEGIKNKLKNIKKELTNVNSAKKAENLARMQENNYFKKLFTFKVNKKK